MYLLFQQVSLCTQDRPMGWSTNGKQDVASLLVYQKIKCFDICLEIQPTG